MKKRGPSTPYRESADEDRLHRLVCNGIVRPGTGRIPAVILTRRPPQPKRNESTVQVLIEERRNGR